MTCREKLAMEHPNDANERITTDCPGDYGYAEEPKYCNPFPKSETCERCWDREVSKEQEERKMTVEELVKVLDKSNVFYVRECHSGKTIFEPGRKTREVWEEVKTRSVEQVKSLHEGFLIFVNVAPPVGQDS